MKGTPVLDFLNSVTPVLVIGGLALFMTLETWMPYFQHGAGRRRQRWRNVGVVAVALAVNIALGGVAVIPLAWSEANGVGLLHRLAGQSVLAIVVGVFVVDLSLYTAHVLMHNVPTFWRFHRVHHADTELDSTSGLRQHPLEAMFTTAIMVIIPPTVGVSLLSLAIYTTIALPWFLLNHSNVRYPDWFERMGSLLMSTPNWHRVHHSARQPETDSNYGCVFSVWDRLFGTARRVEVERIQFGLERFRDSSEQTIAELLKMPFRR
jgi:sterol desaturase/sphingolipid hydroxylase (fatty acid hydroxylase superfamily)